MTRSLDMLYALERQSARRTPVSGISAGAKLLVTLCYVVCVASLARHALFALVPFVLYPVLLQAVCDVPMRLLRTQLLTALPFCGMAALSTLLFERGTAFTLGGVAVSAGAVAFCVILLKTLLCVWAVLLLTATSPMEALTGTLLRWQVPPALVTQLRMTYRYVFLLADEARRMQTAYHLRGGSGGVALARMGAFLGTLLLRSTRHAETVENAMACRGYMPAVAAGTAERFSLRDALFAAVLCGAFVLARCVDLSVLLGSLFV